MLRASLSGLTAIVMMLTTCYLAAQSTCYTSESPINQSLMFGPQALQFENHYMAASEEKGVKRRSDNYDLPVVFHVVVSDGNVDNGIVEARISEAMNLINRSFRGMALCDGDPASTDLGIQLCLAQRTIDNEASSGVYFYERSLANLNVCDEDELLKRIPGEVGIQTPSTDYINIFLVESICAPCNPANCTVEGFSSYAPAHGSIIDGLVLELDLILSEDCNDLKVAMHELGHYFNLLHTFSHSCRNDNCLMDGDKVCDTPPSVSQQTLSEGFCSEDEILNTCDTDVNLIDPNNPFAEDQQDATDNFMAYVPKSCMHHFTEGQKFRMLTALTELRTSLISSRGCQQVCEEPVVFDLTIPDNCYAGSSCLISNQSSEAYTYAWSVQGNEVVSNDLSYTFDTSGVYQISIYPVDAPFNCTDTLTFELFVDCNVSFPEFELSESFAEPGGEIMLSLISPLPDGISIEWIIQGQSYGGDETLIYQPTNEGSHGIYLMVCDEYCCKRSPVQYLQVGPCQEAQAGREWHFGRNVSLKFEEDGSKTLGVSPLSTIESIGIAYNEMGDVLFYFDGFRLYNRLGEFMEPGGFLGGRPSASQVITLRKPGSLNIWYLFYPECYTSAHITKVDYNLYYSVIDMSLNGGLGQVIQKDLILFENTTEKVTAVRHCNGIDWWILFHEMGSANFRIYPFTEDGIEEPIIQEIGSFHGPSSLAVAGVLKPSSDGTKLAVCKIQSSDVSNSASLELFKFNNTSGLIYDPLLIFDDLHNCYSAEFSPDNTKLYSHSDEKYFQLDISTWDEESISLSRHDIILEGNVGEYRIGPDSILYLSTWNTYLRAFLNPNASATDYEYVEEYLDISPGEGRISFPNFPNDIYKTPKPVLIGPSIVCDTSTVVYRIDEDCPIHDYKWHLSDGIQILRNGNNEIEVSFLGAGLDTIVVEVETSCRSWMDTLYIEVEFCGSCEMAFEWAEVDTILCSGMPASLRFYSDSEQVELVNLSSGFTTTLDQGWIQLGILEETTCYDLHISDEYCDSIISFCVQINDALTFDWTLADTLVCMEDNPIIDFQTNADRIELYTQDNSKVYSPVTWPFEFEDIDSSECYYLRLRHMELGCDTLISFCVGFLEEIEFDWISADSLICEGQVADLSFETNATEVELTNDLGEDFSPFIQGSLISGIPGGCYSLKLMAGGCIREENLCIRASPPADFSWNDPIDAVCPGDHVIWTFSTNADQIILNTDEGMEILESSMLDWGIITENSCAMLELVTSNCTSIIDICIEVDNQAIVTRDSIYFCAGDSVMVNGMWISEEGPVVAQFDSGQFCDSTHITEVIMHPQPEYEISLNPSCPNDASGSVELILQSEADYSIKWDTGDEDVLVLSGLSSGPYTLNLQDEFGCSYVHTFFLDEEVIEWPGYSVLDADCSDDALGQIEISSFESNQLYLDSTRINDSGVIPISPGSYQLSLLSPSGCEASKDIQVGKETGPEIILSELAMVIQGESYQIIPEVIHTREVSYLWNPPTWLSCTDCPTPFTTPESDIVYEVEVMDSLLCKAEASIRVIVQQNSSIYIPTAFSPNGDGINDFFEVYFAEDGGSLELMRIYDKWGGILHQCTGNDCKWDGKSGANQLLPGVYLYELSITIPGEEAKRMFGELVLMR